jgi:hypothetical protein
MDVLLNNLCKYSQSIGLTDCTMVFTILRCIQFIRTFYYQLKHSFQRTQDSRSSGDMGSSLFLDEAWFSRDMFLYRLSKVILLLILNGSYKIYAHRLKITILGAYLVKTGDRTDVGNLKFS